MRLIDIKDPFWRSKNVFRLMRNFNLSDAEKAEYAKATNQLQTNEYPV